MSQKTEKHPSPEELAYRAQQEANPAAFPALAAVMDEMRELFDGDVVMVGGAEAGGRVGKMSSSFIPECTNCDGSVCHHPDKHRVWCGHRLVFASDRPETKKRGAR